MPFVYLWRSVGRCTWPVCSEMRDLQLWGGNSLFLSQVSALPTTSVHPLWISWLSVRWQRCIYCRFVYKIFHCQANLCVLSTFWKRGKNMGRQEVCKKTKSQMNSFKPSKVLTLIWFVNETKAKVCVYDDHHHHVYKC